MLFNKFNSLEEPIPTYAHLPMVLSNTGKRLSKRDGAVDLLDYKKLGYLKEALINYLVKLGWTHSDQEIFSKEELLSLFTLEAVNSSPAKFSEDLLNFYNNHYINSIQVEDLYQLINKEYDVPYKIDSNIHYLEILNLLREGSKTILDLISQMQFFYEVPQYEEKYKDFVQANIEIISVFKENINSLNFSDLKKLENDIKEFLSSNDLKFPQLGKPLRLILAGRENAPSISQLLFFLGFEESLKRINLFLTK